jgi:hypothetical protein
MKNVYFEIYDTTKKYGTMKGGKQHEKQSNYVPL